MAGYPGATYNGPPPFLNYHGDPNYYSYSDSQQQPIHADQNSRQYPFAFHYGPYGGYPPVQPYFGNSGGIPPNPYGDGYQSSPPPPPSNPQNFGHGAPENYAYKYSNCSGRRKALLIGINYFGQKGQLRGCINDVKNMSEFLTENYGYQRDDMVILTDDQQNPVSQPTKHNILRAMHWLVKDAQPNDSLFFHFSGHGGQTKDLDGDEEDGYDEVIYPVDFRRVGHIVDDEMHRIMVASLLPGVRLTAIFDSCHSGTALDLPYIYSTQGVLKEPNLAKEAGLGILSAISSYSQGDLGGVASNLIGLFKRATTGENAYAKTMATKTSPADVIMWSGSKDDQTSADATIAAQATGAMSWAFITAMRKNPQQSYVQLLNSIRDELVTKYSQKPQLSCSHPLDTNLLFVM
ncbi:Metacaspase [Blumeria hordei DH14]|uniref:Metacaspase n=1 Tax=Blumeria graminis f. sp. hordei (strain DH14) TaxID=546991 RepID=N1J6M4_BLUG1|nr:Metacaspase [Blumeria hordei DH14]